MTNWRIRRYMYEEFVEARHAAYLRRLGGIPPAGDFDVAKGWCPEDHIVNTRKFTNVFRLLDRGTQFVQRDLMRDRHIEESFSDALFRAFLYRYTNIPEPWIAYRETVGRYPRLVDLNNGDLRRFWTEYANQGNPIFGNAYKMFVGRENSGKTRLQWVLDLADHMVAHTRLYAFEQASTAVRAEMLQEIPRCGPFMTMQILADLEDSPWVQGDGNGYIIPGPGAIIGAKELGVDKGDVVQLIHNLRHAWYVDGSVRLPGWGATPSLMDVQNTLCEFGKYVRWSDDPRSASRKPYVGKHPVGMPFIPPHLRK